MDSEARFNPNFKATGKVNRYNKLTMKERSPVSMLHWWKIEEF